LTRELDKLVREAKRAGLGDVIADVIRDYLHDEKKAARFYSDFHWGTSAEHLEGSWVPCAGKEEILVELGTLAEVAYEADKGGERAIWVHAFKQPKPVLAYNTSGGIFIVGGNYRVTARGIVG
jgi:hypothetical protein